MPFQNLEDKSESESLKRTISADGGLGAYKWYQSQTLGDVSARRLCLEGGGHKAMCQQGRWASKGWIVRSQIGWEENKTPFISVCEPLLAYM